MNTKFSKILKLRQDVLNKIEKEIIEVNALINLKKQEIANLISQIASFSPPKSSTYSVFLAFREMQSNIRYKIQEEQSFLEMLEARKVDTLKKYNKAKVEYEKINYLHTSELKIIIDRQKRLEQKQLDEYGSILRLRYAK